jgi:hypothetical protein
MEFSRATVERAVRAVRLGAIAPRALERMGRESVSAAALAGEAGVAAGLTRSALGETAVEDELMWLFRVGVVRREVDGQGITDRFRLTPLGQRVLVELGNETASPGLGDQLGNWLTRWLG